MADVIFEIPGQLNAATAEGKIADASQVKDSSLNNVSQKTLNKNIPFKTLPLTQMLTSKPTNINTNTVYTGGGTNVKGVVGYKYNDGGEGPLAGFVFSANDKYYAKWDVTGYPSSEAYANSEYNLFLVNGTINRIVAGELSPLTSGGSSGGSGLPEGVTISGSSTDDYVFGNNAKLGKNTTIGSDVSISYSSSGVQIGDRINVENYLAINSDGDITIGTATSKRMVLSSNITILGTADESATLFIGSKCIYSGTDKNYIGIELGTNTDGVGAKLVIGSDSAKVCDFSDNLLYELGGGSGGSSGSGGNVESEGGDYLHLAMGTLNYKDSLGTTYFAIHYDAPMNTRAEYPRSLQFGTSFIAVQGVYSKLDDFRIELNPDINNIKLTAGTNTSTVDFVGNVHIGTDFLSIPQGNDKPYSIMVFDQANSRIVFKCIDLNAKAKYAVLPLKDSLEDYSVAAVSDDTIEV